MSHEENFKDAASLRHLVIAFVALLGMPLLPMLMGWFTFLQ